MKPSISEIVGRGEDAQGKEVSVYRALRSLLCSRCGSGINEGELFTRRKLAGIRISPFCQECIPFKPLHAGNSSSALIDYLLTHEPAIGNNTKTLKLSNRTVVFQEVEKRLGPALARCRKSNR